MSPWLWLGAAVLAGVGAVLIGGPTWSAYQARRVQDANNERYLAWRGRADRSRQPAGLLAAERNRLIAAGVLAVLALFCLAAFLTYQ